MLGHEDSLCLRCGRCCFKKIRTESGAVYFTPFRCKYLGLDGLCSIYPRRHFAKDANCLTILEAIAAGCLPSDCPYVRDREGYVGPREKPDLWKNPSMVRHIGLQLGASEKEIRCVIAEKSAGMVAIPRREGPAT